MQVSVKTTGKLGRTMQVEVPEERITSEVANRLKRLSRTTRIQGFRPGKAPMKVVEQRYGGQVRQEVIGEVVQSSFFEAIGQEKLRPAGGPVIDPVELKAGKGLSYTATFEVYPEVKLAKLEKLKIKRPECDISDADLEKMVDTLRTQRRTHEPVERAAANGDVLVVDFAGSIEGEPFAGGEAQDFRLELGAGRLIDGFEDALLGSTAGEERMLDLTFPDNYGKPELAGKPVQFKVNVKQVLGPKLPELDEKFFREFGVADGTEESFRKEVRDHMQREAATHLRTRLRDSVMDALFTAHKVELPQALVDQEVKNLQQQFQKGLKAYGIEADKLDDKLRDPAQFEERARKRVTLQLVVGEIIRAQDLKAEPGKVRQLIEKNAQSYEDPAAIINWYYADKSRLADVEALALEDEVIDWIVGVASVSAVKVAFDDLLNKGQTEAA